MGEQLDKGSLSSYCRSMIQFMLKCIRALLVPVFPQRCVLCLCELSGTEMFFQPETHAPLCRNCAGQLPVLSGRRCNVCSEPLVSEKDLCTACRDTSCAFESNTSVFHYQGMVKELVWVYKFGKQRSCASVFIPFFLSLQTPGGMIHKENFTSIIPVPASPESLKRRGFDQAKVIAAMLALKTGIPFQPVLKRGRGIAQKKLSRSKRQLNLSGQVFFTPRHEIGPRPLLIDDIFTTGSTGNECSLVLKQHGAMQVHVVTIAKD